MMESDLPAEQLARTLFEDGQDALFVVDADLRKIIQANRVAQDWTGLNLQDLLAIRFDQLIRWQADDQTRLADASYDPAKAPSPHRALLRTREQRAVPVNVTLIPLPGSKTQRQVLVVAKDVSPLHVLESGNKALMERLSALELENAQTRSQPPAPAPFEQVGPTDLAPAADLVQAIAKHFNDLATVIVASATLVRGGTNSKSPLQNHLHAIEDAARRSADMMAILLGAVGRTPLHRREVSMGALLQEALQTVHFVQELSVSSTSETVNSIIIDADAVRLALHHVLQNAADAMPTQGQVTIDAATVRIEPGELTEHDEHARPGSFVRITITDTGAGMASETLRRAGTPFFTTKNDPKRMGVGLAYAKGILAQHGGWLELHSRPGQGSRAVIFLPHTPETPERK
jgi:PAS domain S-box-containing protein